MLTLLTPTSDRPQALQLCVQWMAAQTFEEPIQWVIVDDGEKHTTLDLSPLDDRFTVEKIDKPRSRSAPLSFRGNMATGLMRAEHDRLLFIEDDDHYKPDWLQYCWDQFEEGADLVGETRARYYHVPNRRFAQLSNRNHASLCSTGISRRLFGWLDKRLRLRGGTFIDIDLWKASHRKSITDSRLVTGMKGLPGRSGIGTGHRFGEHRGRHDPHGSQLRKWVGDSAAQIYLNLYRNDVPATVGTSSDND